MSIDGRTTDQALDEVADAQASLDPTRSECVRPTILDHFHRWMRAKSMTDKFMELDGLIRACTPHLNDPRTIKDVYALLSNPTLRQDILTKHTDKYLTGVPISVLENNECWTRYPLLADIWDLVQKDLVRSGLLPWALTYPERMLEGQMLNRLLEEIESEVSAQPIREQTPAILSTESMPLLATGAILPFAPPLVPSTMPPLDNTPEDESATSVEELADTTSPTRPRRVPFGPRPVDMDHATYMKTRMATLHEEVEHIADWRPDELPVPPAEIDVAADTIKQALKRSPKKNKR